MVFQQFAGINGIVFYASETFVTSGGGTLNSSYFQLILKMCN